MEAVADPLPTQELYFVADGTGGHVFANSLKEHNRNVAEWRKIQARMEKEAAEKANTPLPASETPTVDEKPIDKQGSDENLKQRLQQNGLMLVPVEADSWPDGLMQLAQAMEPPMAADQFDGVASFPVPERMRKKKTGQPAKLDGTVNPGMADNPEATVPPGELGPTVSQQAGAAPIKRRRRAIDASEGKKIDPLLRKNYDLNSTQLVPAL
jgi:UPF0755 protein